MKHTLAILLLASVQYLTAADDKQWKVANLPEIVPDAPHTFALVSAKLDFRTLVFGFLDKHLRSIGS